MTTWGELCEALVSARADLPVQIKLGNGKTVDVVGVDLVEEFVPMKHPLKEADPKWIDLEKAGAQPWERTQDHRVSAAVLRTK